MAASRPFAYGMCMAGAGGGGFLYVLTKDANHKHLLMDILNTVEGTEGKEIYECSIDTEGLVLSVEDWRRPCGEDGGQDHKLAQPVDWPLPEIWIAVWFKEAGWLTNEPSDLALSF